MTKTTAGRGVFRLLVAVFFLLIGVVVCFLNWIAGVIIILLVLILDPAPRKVWKCQRCGSIVERD